MAFRTDLRKLGASLRLKGKQIPTSLRIEVLILISSDSYYSLAAYSGTSTRERNSSFLRTPAREAVAEPSPLSKPLNRALSSLGAQALQGGPKFESMQEGIDLDEDGTYSFHQPEDASSRRQQHSERTVASDTSAGMTKSAGNPVYDQADMEMFRKLTKNNLAPVAERLVPAPGDNDVAPSQANGARADAVRELVASAGLARQDGELSGRLTLDNVAAVLDRFETTGSNRGAADQLLKDLLTNLGASAPELASLTRSTHKTYNGQEIYTWAWPGMADARIRPESAFPASQAYRRQMRQRNDYSI